MTSRLLRPLSIGEILDGAFTIYRRHFTTFLGTAFGILSPVLVLAFVFPILSSIAGVFLNLAALGACVWLASEAILGREPRLGEGIGVGLRRSLPLLGWGMIYGMGIGIASLALIIPGVLLWIMWFAFWPIVVIERASPFGRSRFLATESWQKIFVVSLVGAIIVMLPAMLFQVGAVMALGFETVVQAKEPNAFVTLGGTLITVLTVPFTTSLQTLLYYDQRVRKEGFDVAHTAANLETSARSAATP